MELLYLVSVMCLTVSVNTQRPTNMYVRLRGGPTPNSGRVEVRSNMTEAWGTVCDDYWGNKDATVVCRMLGYKWGTEYRYAHFGQGTGPIYLDNVECVGNETSLTQCRFVGWGIHNCGHSEDAGVSCGNDTFKLDGGMPHKTNYGVVMYRDPTGWKTVCDSFWDDNDAKVACRSMGYVDGSALCCNKLSMYRTNPYMYWRRSRNNLNCTGNEATIFDCPNTNQNTACQQRHVASAICYTKSKDEVDMSFRVNLVNGSSTSGIVQITHMGQPGKICANNWNDNSSAVACKNMGFTGGYMYGYASFRFDLPVWATSVNCTGQESQLRSCINSPLGAPATQCYSNHVLCYQGSPPSVSLSGGRFGRVQINYNNVQGTLCDNTYSTTYAGVICRQLGYSDGNVISGSYYGQGSGPVYMGNLYCRGTEPDIFRCRNQGWLTVDASCTNHSRDASVYCFNDVKLTKGDHSHGIANLFIARGRYGRRNYWAPICGTGFTNVEATVVCREMGFQSGRVMPTGSYGRLYTSSYYYYGNNVTCTGNENSIRNCSTTSGTCSTRSGTGYAAVACYNGTLSTNTTVSLQGVVGEYSSVTGRIQVIESGVRGRICQSYWDDRDANVTCKQLGLRGGVSYQYSQSGIGPFLLNNVGCYGNESSIFECATGDSICTTNRDAGALCYRTTAPYLRLTGGTSSQGRVEIVYDGMPGTICATYSNNQAANVVCKQLGFNGGESTAVFGPGRGLVYMTNPYCYGVETSIFQCRNPGFRSVSNPTCLSHSKDLGVYCYGKVKLYRGTRSLNATTGIVQYYRSGSYRTVCSNGFDNNDAKVICRTLGFPYGMTLPPGAFSYHYFSRYQAIRYLNCSGSETDISQCGFTLGTCYGTSYTNYAAVLCTKTPLSSFRYNVTMGSTFPSTIQVYNFGITVTFCSDTFTDREARVACRAQGYTSGVAFGPIYRYNVPHILGVTCNGNETDLNDCTISTTVPSSCSSSYKAPQIYCFNGNTQPQVRLIQNGRVSNQAGRVEVQIGGVWGTICDSSFSSNDAKVVCRQLGYPDGNSRGSSYYGRGSGPSWFYRSYCSGTEKAIWNCRYSTFNTTSSTCRYHRYDASVQCTGTVRLPGTQNYGPVMIWDGSSTYNLICADNFNDVDAKVACKEMGYRYGVRVGASAFGYQRYSIGYTNVRCRGSETSIKNCPYDVSLTYCPSRKYASVACSNVVPGSGYTMSIENTYYGRVTIRHMNINGYICPDGFDDKVATVICREKGYLGGFGYKYYNYYYSFRSSTTMRWLSEIKCDGTETYLSNCDGVRYGDTNNCSRLADAAVYCYRNSSLQVRLGNKTGSAGRIEFAVDGNWGTMCTYGTSDSSAKAICSMLNYTDGKGLASGTFGPGSGPIYVSYLYCSSSDSSIKQCRSRWRSPSSSCSNHQRDNAVMCYDNVRLTGSRNANYGRVEVYKNNQWTPVCDHNFDNAAARVVCKKLGYVDGRAQCCNAVGQMDASKITFVINGCTGSEADLFGCNVGTGQCATGKYVTVYCSYSSIIRNDPIVRIPTSRNYGAVQMNRYGFWGPICGNGWNNNDASVACKSMGYAGGIKFAGRYYNRAPMVVGKFQCTGSESNITQCPFKDLDDNVDLGCNAALSWYTDGAGALCWDSGDGGIGIRLVNGTGRKGRLEVSYKGQWGRVCGGWSWSNTDAKVACKQLGYADGTTYPVRRSSATKVWMNYLYCNGNEQSLFECPMSWNSRWSCYSDAGVICYDTTRLVRGNQYSTGLVQVSINNNWGSVCATGWNNNDVAVTCSQMGYQKGFNLCCGAFGSHYASAVMDNVKCTGAESKLAKCPHSVPHTSYCESNAAVACYNGTADTTTLNWRLADGNNYTGEVLVDFINITGRICTDGWDDKDAKVLCRSLGYSKGQAYTHYRYTYDANNGPIWTSNFGCSGTENSLSSCSHDALGSVSSCKSIHSAGVLCGDNAGIYYRLSGGQDNAGRVEVSVNGVWGSVCRSYFDNNEATVLCKTLGYNVGTADYITRYPNGTGPVYESQFRCTGKEGSLAQCPHKGWKQATTSYCAGHRYDAAVVCYGDVKLASGFSPSINQGPVQVWHNNSWHYVCDTNFNDVSAKTVCKYLGFVDGKSLCCSAYGTKYVKYSWYGNGPGSLLPNMTMRCDGSQSDPLNCIVPGTCSNNYASVVCFNSTDIISESYTFSFDDTTSKSGQVAVQHYGIKGRICSTFWTDSEATVFCKSLNYDNGIAYHHSVNYNYQPIRSRGPFWISGVNCTGTESSLSACSFGNRTSLGNCSGADIASAICYNGDQGIKYRMVAPDNSTNKNYGRVEMSVGGVWGTICDRYFDRREATVFCRQMNFVDGYSIPGAHYGQGTGPMWLSGLQCKGTETALHQCPHSGFRGEVVSGYSYYWCRSHRYDVSVYCVDKLKLNTGLNASMGAVEVYANNKWNTVCDSGFDDKAASVVCRTIGYQYGINLGGSLFGNTDGAIGISSVTCNGRESDFSKCKTTASTTCKSGTYASVICSNTEFVDNGFQTRIVQDDPAAKTHGYIEVNINGIWGSVCGTGFTDRSANIVCKEKGFRGGVAYQSAVLNPYYTGSQTIVKEKSPILMTEIHCTGNEGSLNKCSYKPTSKTSWCDYYAPRAGVLCYARDGIQYRLAGDTNPMQGRIEMKYDNQWGTVCDPSGLSRSASVACKSVGQVDGLPVSNARYRVTNDNRPVWFHYFRCNGNETTLPLCRHDGFDSSVSVYKRWMSYYCRNYGPASAKCFKKKVQVTQIRLANGPTNNTGRVEVYLQGPDQWGTVCDDYWDDKDATVVCMMLGFAQGKAMMRATYGQGSGPVWMDNLGCKGTESHLSDCPHNGYAIENCRHSEDAGVQCFGVLPITTPSSNGTGPATKRIYTDNGNNAAAIAAPIVCSLIIVAAVIGFLYYRRLRLNKSGMGENLVPDTPATSGTSVNFGSGIVAFSKSANQEPIEGVSNPNYDEIGHVDQQTNA